MFKRQFLKNLIYMIPAFVISAMLFVIASQLSLLEKNKVYQLKDISDGDIFLRLGRENVYLDLDDNLIYSGFDIKKDGEVIGKYYYRTNDNQLMLYGLLNDTAARLESGEAGIEIYARIVQDNAISESVQKEYSSIIKLGDNVLDGYVHDVILDETQYPKNRIFFIGLTKIVSIVLILISLITLFISSWLQTKRSEVNKKEEPAL